MRRMVNRNARWMVARNENEKTAAHKSNRARLTFRALKQRVVRARKGRGSYIAATAPAPPLALTLNGRFKRTLRATGPS